jgi:hypothetical protein
MKDFAKMAAMTGYAAGREAMKDQWPGLKDDILDAAGELVESGVERACDYAEEKTNELADKWIDSYENRTGVKFSDFDANGDGSLSFGEAIAAFEVVNTKSKEREEKGEDPIPWTTRYGETGLIVLLALLGIGGAKKGGKKAVEAVKAIKRAANGGENA